MEKALDIVPTGRSAEDICEFVRTSMEKHGLNFDGLVTQAYDGARVMSGNWNGLQVRLSGCLGRLVIYIHCFAHILNLLIKYVINSIPDLMEYFARTSSVYNFFKLSNVNETYEGTSLKRSIEIRWSGHLEPAKALQTNYAEIRKTLQSSRTNKKLESDQLKDYFYKF